MELAIHSLAVVEKVFVTSPRSQKCIHCSEQVSMNRCKVYNVRGKSDTASELVQLLVVSIGTHRLGPLPAAIAETRSQSRPPIIPAFATASLRSPAYVASRITTAISIYRDINH